MRDDRLDDPECICTREAWTIACPVHPPGPGWWKEWEQLDVTCRLCDEPITAGQWITSDGVHHACAEQFPDAMFG